MAGIAAQKNTISKSQYLKGLQCPKALWLYRRRKDVAPQLDQASRQRMFVGSNVGELARQYFAERGPVVEIRLPFWQIEEGAQQTSELLAEGQELILEAAAIHQDSGAYSRIDILRRDKYGQVDLVEVKSAGRVKGYHIEDMAFQYYVFEGAGFSIRACYMMLIDTSYVRCGDLELDKLFQFCDISSAVRARQRKVLEQTAELGHLLRSPREPALAMGSQCYRPFRCAYIPYCQGSHSSELFPATLPPEREAPATCQRDTHQRASGPSLQRKPLGQWLAKLRYPLYFLDYECFQPAVPLFDHSSPYQMIPFQFSLHRLDSEGHLQHWAFLHLEKSDPRPALLAELLRHTKAERGDQGSVLVYNQSFEKSINKALGRDFPQHQAAMQQLDLRICDMLVPFRQRWLYSPEQRGSVSLKAVLPAFTDLSYQDLAICDGQQAMIAYLAFMLGDCGETQLAQLRRDLLEYCQRDTLALVKLLQILKERQQGTV